MCVFFSFFYYLLRIIALLFGLVVLGLGSDCLLGSSNSESGNMRDRTGEGWEEILKAIGSRLQAFPFKAETLSFFVNTRSGGCEHVVAWGGGWVLKGGVDRSESNMEEAWQ